MTELEKKEIRRAIEKRLDELKSQVYDLKSSFGTTDEGKDALSRMDRIDQSGNKTVTDVSIKNAESDIRNLEKWLVLYDTNKFAICESCGNQIETDKLLSSPESRFCHACSSK